MEAATPAPPQPPVSGGSVDYPVRVGVGRQEEYARFLPLVKWLLAIPHLFALIFVLLAVAIAKFIAFWAVIFTRRYPRGLYDFVLGAFRWAFRVGAYVGLLTDRYPPFSLQPEPDYPVVYEFEYPEEIDRWRPLVQWFLAIPSLIIVHALGYLMAAITLIAFFTILFTRNYPEGMFKIVLAVQRWQVRTVAYAGFMVTRYPPFEWDDEL
jgi:hypothetical protein